MKPEYVGEQIEALRGVLFARASVAVADHPGFILMRIVGFILLTLIFGLVVIKLSWDPWLVVLPLVVMVIFELVLLYREHVRFEEDMGSGISLIAESEQRCVLMLAAYSHQERLEITSAINKTVARLERKLSLLIGGSIGIGFFPLVYIITLAIIGLSLQVEKLLGFSVSISITVIFLFGIIVCLSLFFRVKNYMYQLQDLGALIDRVASDD